MAGASAWLRPRGSAGAHAHPDLRFLGFHPVNELDGPERVALDFLAPLLTAFPDLLRRSYICCAGQHNNATWVATTGDFVGSFIQDWLGIPASGRSVHMRFAEFCRVEDGRVREIMLLIDLISLMRQCGHQALPPESGDTSWIPGPRAGDGMRLDHVDPADSARSLDLMLAMIDSLNEYDGANLVSMSMTCFWTEDMRWYGPAGIGSTIGLGGFEQHHQIPFLRAFPDRGKLQGKGYSGHFIRIGDGDYAVTGGRGLLLATHSGVDWLGFAPTGKVVNMRVMDFYRCDTDDAGVTSLRENWVPIDIPHLLLQMGVVVVGRMRHQHRQAGAISASDFLLRSLT